MTLLLRMIGELLWGAVLWLGLLALVTGGIGLAGSAATRGRVRVPRAVGWAIGAGVTVMALAHRLGLPDPLAMSMVRRDLLLSWAAAGAVLGVTAATAIRSSSSPTTEVDPA